MNLNQIIDAVMAILEHVNVESLVILAFIMHVLGRLFAGSTGTRPLAVKFGCGVFVLWLVMAVSTGGLSDSSHLVSTALRGLLLGVMTTGTLTLVFSLAQNLRRIVDDFLSPIRRWSDGRRHQRTLQEERKRQQEEQARLLAEQEQAAPAQQQAAALARQQEQVRQAEQLRREQIRFDVRLFYDRYRRELADVFPEEKFDAYFQSFLTDSTASDVFEQRAERLKDMIRDRLELSSRQQSAGFETIDEVIAHYDGKRQLISQLPVDDEVREDFLMQLDDSMERDLREFL